MQFIPGYEGLYSAERDGRIFSHIKNRYIGCYNKNRIYHRVDLTKDDVCKSYNIHRLIALTFIPNPENKPCVDHIDRDKHNNAVSNLRWVTYAENSANLPKYKTNCSGYQNIGTKRSVVNGVEYVYYTVEYVRNGQIVFIKHSKSLNEAIQVRDEYLKTITPS
jgi:hypothetical protein